MDTQNQPESLDKIIHKESSKEKLKVEGLKPLGRSQKPKELKEGNTHLSQQQMSNEQQPKELSKHRLAKLRANAEIDEFLMNLLLEGMINEQYWNYHAKACHTLGIQLCNRLAINARNGINSQNLYGSKIAGAMALHHKRYYEAMS